MSHNIQCAHPKCPEPAEFWATPKSGSPFGVCRDHLGELMPNESVKVEPLTT